MPKRKAITVYQKQHGEWKAIHATNTTMSKTTKTPPAPENGTWLKKGEVITDKHKWLSISGKVFPSDAVWVGQARHLDYPQKASSGEYHGWFLPGDTKTATPPTKPVKTQKKPLPAASGTVLNVGTKFLYVRLDGIPRKNLVGKKVTISLK